MRKDFEYWLDAATKHPDATMPTPWQIWQAATLAEREACAKLAAPKAPRPCECESCDCGNKDDAQRVAEWDAENFAATAIRLRSNAEVRGA